MQPKAMNYYLLVLFFVVFKVMNELSSGVRLIAFNMARQLGRWAQIGPKPTSKGPNLPHADR